VSALSILDITKATSILPEDVTATLLLLGLLQKQDNNDYVIYAPKELLKALEEKFPNKGIQVYPSLLNWAPLYVTDPKKDKWSLKSKLGRINQD
jgi:hypothetical protein